MKKKQEKITIEKLAIMIKNGFDSVDERFDKIEKDIKEFKKENKREHEAMNRENAREHEEMKRENTKEHDDLKLRQDSMAYRFELVDLQGRVEKLEKIVVKN